MSEKPHILFVDDEINILKSLGRILRDRRDQWDMLFACGADEALEKLNNYPVDVAIIDVKMPGTDGLELLGIMQSSPHTRDIPVAILSGCQETDLKSRALALGAADLLNKPINREDLQARIESMLRLKSSQDDLRLLNDTLEQQVEQRTAELQQARKDIIWRLAKAGEFRDEETGEHVVRVGCYSRLIAEEIGMSPEFTEMIFLTAPLHDIGKIGIPDSILLKSGRLSPQEQQVMQSHCEIGAKILTHDAKGMRPFDQWKHPGPQTWGNEPKNALLDMASSIAMCHHERWDSTGYPQQLTGDEIPLCARIVFLADIYDALTSRRPYKPAYTHAESVKIMRSEASANAFDPVVFEVFEKIHDEFWGIRNEYKEPAPVEEALHA